MVGAAESLPPASGTIALFSIAIAFDVFSSPLPELAARVVVQLVSGLSLNGEVDCANVVPAANEAATMAAAIRIIVITNC